MQCPICGDAKLIHDTRDVPYTYKGETTVIESVTGDFCPACGEIILDMTEARRFGQLIHEFNEAPRSKLRGIGLSFGINK